MRRGGREDRVGVGRRVEPGEEGRHVRRHPAGRRCGVVHALGAERPRHHLHRSAGIVAPGPGAGPGEAAATGREQRRVPAEQPLVGQRRVEVPRGVEHHLDDALDVAIDRRECGCLHAEPAGERGSHLPGVQALALDLAGLHHVLGEGAQHRLGAKLEAEAAHAAQQNALAMPEVGEGAGQCGDVPAQIRPARALPDSRHILRSGEALETRSRRRRDPRRAGPAPASRRAHGRVDDESAAAPHVV